MTIRLAEACLNNMNTTADTATTETTTTNFLAQIDMKAVTDCINNPLIAAYLSKVQLFDNWIVNNPNAPASQINVNAAGANVYQQKLQALQTKMTGEEQEYNQLPDAGQTLVSNDNNAVAQMATIMQSVNQGPGYLSNLMAGAL